MKKTEEMSISCQPEVESLATPLVFFNVLFTYGQDCKNQTSCADVIVAPSIEAKYSKSSADWCIWSFQVAFLRF